MDYEIEIEEKFILVQKGMLARHNGDHGVTDWVWRWSKVPLIGYQRKYVCNKNDRIYTKSYLYCRKRNGKNELEKIDATKHIQHYHIYLINFQMTTARKN